MGKHGMLDFGKSGFAMPITNSAYPKPPYHGYVENLHVRYETDYEAAAPLLPAELEFADEVPVVNIGVTVFHFTTYGRYLEGYLSYDVLYKGERWNYYPYWLCGPYHDGTMGETGMLMGREYFGTAKKLAKIELVNDNNVIVGKISRPGIMPLVTIAMSPEYHVDAPEEGCDMTIDLRYIPGVEEGAGPDVCQLVASPVPSWPRKLSDGLVDVWGGAGSVTFHSTSAQDPWHLNKVNKILSATYGNYSKLVKPGYVLHDYLKKG